MEKFIKKAVDLSSRRKEKRWNSCSSMGKLLDDRKSLKVDFSKDVVMVENLNDKRKKLKVDSCKAKDDDDDEVEKLDDEEEEEEFSEDDNDSVQLYCYEVTDYHKHVCWVHSRLKSFKNRTNLIRESDAAVWKTYITLDTDDYSLNERKRGASFNQINTIFKGKNLPFPLLSDLLGDYLITNNAHQIKTNELMGKKYVVLFIPNDPDSSDYPYPDTVSHSDLLLSYKELKEHHNPFETEIVFVPSKYFSTEGMFVSWFSQMPWLSVPFDRHDIRERLVGMFGKRWIILDPDGKVLRIDGEYIFHYYGAESYPFTDDRIQEIQSQDARLFEKSSSFSLEALLGSPHRDYLLSSSSHVNTNRHVSISELEGKTIGLLFLDICPSCKTYSFVRRLEEVYKQLKQRIEIDTSDFEIVFVHLPLDCLCREKGEEFFDSNFQRMPWLALPYNDPTCRKLWRIFHLLEKDEIDPEYVTFDRVLAIVGPYGEFLERDLGARNAFVYGIDGYPFTQRRAAEIEKGKLEALTLDSYFDIAGNVSLRNNCGKEVCVSTLSGKRIFIIFAAYYCFKYSEFLRKLKRLYTQNQGTAEEFEVIHFSMECSESSYDKCAAKMPWLMYPYNQFLMYKLANVIFPDLYNDLPGLAVFGRNGKFLTKQRLVMDNVKMDRSVFPFFVAEDLCEQIIQELPIFLRDCCYLRTGCY